MRIVRDQQAAEDVAQETYVRASKAIETGPIDHIEAFLYQTARNLAINHKRRLDMRGRIERDGLPEADVENIASSVPDQEADLIHRQRLQCLNEAVAKLPQRARTVWLLSRIEKWSYPKIANISAFPPIRSSTISSLRTPTASMPWQGSIAVDRASAYRFASKYL